MCEGMRTGGQRCGSAGRSGQGGSQRAGALNRCNGARDVRLGAGRHCAAGSGCSRLQAERLDSGRCAGSVGGRSQ